MRKTETAKALVMSVLALVLCLAMLVGTTMAWFTDSVTTGVNKIVAGNLDVELCVKNAEGTYVPVDENTPLFDENALWEPGYTQVVYLKVQNLGSLALKYQFAVTVVDETPGKNVAGDTFKLSDYLVFSQMWSANHASFGSTFTRNTIRSLAGDKMGLKDYTKERVLLPGDGAEGTESVDYVALFVYMPEEVRNEANYREEKPEITLGVTLVATQAQHESDSFNNAYDKDAAYPTLVSSAKELTDALGAGGNIALAKDITLTSKVDVTEDTVIDLNGKTISAPYQKSALDVTAGNVIIKNGTLKITSGVSESALYAGGTANVTVENCTIESNYGWALPVVTNGSYSKDATIVIKDSEIKNTANGFAAYIPAGDVSLINCDVTGYICVSGGNVTLDGGTYTSNGFDGQTYCYEKQQAIDFLKTNKGDGAKGFGDSITVLDGRAGYTYGSLTIRNIDFYTTLNWADLYAIRYVDLQETGATKYTDITIEGNTYHHLGISAFRMDGTDVTLP